MQPVIFLCRDTKSGFQLAVASSGIEMVNEVLCFADFKTLEPILCKENGVQRRKGSIIFKRLPVSSFSMNSLIY